MDTTLIRGLVSYASYLLSSSPQHQPRVMEGEAATTQQDDSSCPAPSATPPAPRSSRCSCSCCCRSSIPPTTTTTTTTAAAATTSTTTTEGGGAPSPSSSSRWIRPLGYCERLMTSAHGFGCMTTVYALWLDARQPVTFHLIKEATSIMSRKMPHLRLALGRHKGQLWWRQMQAALVDVKELTTEDVVATLEGLLRRRYDMEEGPLWFVRFASLSPHGQCVRDRNYNEKYKYVCIFGFHHNMSDGTTNMKFCKVFVQVLNHLLSGQDVDMREEGTFARPLHDHLADAASTQWSLLCTFLYRFYKGVLSYGAYIRNFTRLFPLPAHITAATRVLHHELDEATSWKLYLRCKMEGVTINSAFTAAANLALLRMMAAKEDSLDTTSINCAQAVNMRRYWPKELQPDTFGCHISTLDVSFTTRRQHLDEFWEYSRYVHATLTHHLTTTQRALSVQPISERMKIVIGSNYWLDRLHLPSTNDNHYCVTNMGNLSSTFPGTGAEVEVCKVLRSVSCHFMPTLCQHTLQTFRGRLCYSLDYYTQKLTRDTASQYAQEILDILTSAIHTPN